MVLIARGRYIEVSIIPAIVGLILQLLMFFGSACLFCPPTENSTSTSENLAMQKNFDDFMIEWLNQGLFKRVS